MRCRSVWRWGFGVAVCCLLSSASGWVAFSSAASAADVAAAASAAGNASPENVEFFEKQVRPLLIARCHECHSGAKAKAHFRLDSRAAFLAGGDTGPAVVAGKPQQSLLIDAVNYGDTYQMPPKSKLPNNEIAVLTKWVELGAPWPAEPAAAERGPAGADIAPFDLAKRRGEHWCWQPITPQAPPAVKDETWPAGAIDRFILAKLEQHDLRPAGPAARATLLRRLSFDLIGLPPTPTELAEFEADTSEDAVAKVVDRLLASPRHGERWARHWLDLMRYSETRGGEYDIPYLNNWQYRDYVIRAINADVPYDQWLIEHLAGDLVAKPRLHPSKGFNESILGTGFYLMSEESHSPVDTRQDEADRLDNRLDVLAKAFLGLTVTCARCHDHKFDAISQRDYYALAGFLAAGTYRQVRFETLQRELEIARQLDAWKHTARRRFGEQLAAAYQPVLAHTADCLLAARQAILETAQLPADDAAAREAKVAAHITALAASHSLDADLLTRWIAELHAARDDLGHPLHGFALAAHDPTAVDNNAGTELPKLLAASKTASGQPSAAASPGVQVLADYRDPQTPWFQDGFVFGLGPHRAGELTYGSAPAVKSSGDAAGAKTTQDAGLGFALQSAARRDPLWNCLQGQNDMPAERSRLGDWQRVGRTLRTQDVMFATGSLWYLVKGPVRVYAVVDTHLMVFGPLHGQLFAEFKDDADRWRWVHHDLRGYAGHRGHIEFTPVGDAPLSIARVIDSGPDPTPLPAASNWLSARLSAGPPPDSLPALAAEYQRLLSEVMADVATDRIVGAVDAEAKANVADWLARHSALWTARDSAQRADVAALQTQLQAELAEFAAQDSGAVADGAGPVRRKRGRAAALCARQLAHAGRNRAAAFAGGVFRQRAARACHG